MKKLLTSPVYASLAIIAAGLLVVAFIFPYYAFHWGVPACQGLPTDAANCGDADFGGVYFLFTGVPLVVFGLLSLFFYWMLKSTRPHFNGRRFVVAMGIGLALLAALLAALFWA